MTGHFRPFNAKGDFMTDRSLNLWCAIVRVAAVATLGWLPATALAVLWAIRGGR